MEQDKSHSAGFAVLEFALLLFIIIAVVGIGVWVYHLRNESTLPAAVTTASTASASGSTSSSSTNTSSASQNIVNNIENEANSETSIDQKSSSNEPSQAGVNTATVTQVGDSANAASF